MSKTNFGSPHNVAQLCAFIEEKVKVAEIKQLQNNNGSWVTSLLEYIDDNPCVIEYITDLINSSLPEEEEEEEEEEEG